MGGVALFDRGPVTGSFTDVSGAELSYVIRRAEGTVDEMSADMDVTCGGWTVRADADFARGRGTRFSSIWVRSPESEGFTDHAVLVRLCPVSLITDGVFPHDFGFSMSDCLSHAIMKRLEALGLPELPEACRVADGIMTWPSVDGRA